MALIGDDGDKHQHATPASSPRRRRQQQQQEQQGQLQQQQQTLPARATEPDEAEQEQATAAPEQEGTEELETDDEDVGLGLDLDDRNLLIQLLMNQQMSSGYPITSRVFERHMDTHYEASSCSLQGYRDAMEDEHVIHFKLKNNPQCSVFGVFDGHGGNLASKFVKAAVIPMLEAIPNGVFDGKALIECVKQIDMKWIEFENKRKRLQQTHKKREQQQEEKQALQFTLDSDEAEEEEAPQPQEEKTKKKETETETEEEEEDFDLEQEEDEFMKEMLSRSFSDEKTTIKDVDESLLIGTNEYGSVGSTCVFSIVEYNEKADNYTVTTVNLGDSRAIVLKNEMVYIGGGDPSNKQEKKETDEEDEDDEDEDVDIVEQSKPKQPEKLFTLYELTTDHKPTLEAERQRIERAGGFIKFNRVDGDLALSRAIGDTKYKRNKALSHEEQKISCIPTVTQTQCNADDYLLVFCDGIVEYKNNVDVFHCLTKSIQTNIIDYDKQLELAKVVEAKKQSESHSQQIQQIQEEPPGPQQQQQPEEAEHEEGGNDEDDEEEEEEMTDEDELRRLPEMSICEHLRESELNFLTHHEKLGLIPKHRLELKRLEKVLLELTEWALDTGSKDNMTAVLVKIGKTNIHNNVSQRIWNPCPFYKNKMEFNHIGDEIKDGNAATLDRFMRLFEADCAKLGWNMNEDYQNALLQKILYVNDLITTYQQKKDIQELIQMQTDKLRNIERDRETQKQTQRKKKKKKQKQKKRKKMDEDDAENEQEKENGNGNGNGDHGVSEEYGQEIPRKKRKLNE